MPIHRPFFTIILFTTSLVLNAQLMQSGDIASTISTIISNIPGEDGEDYTEPDNAQLAQFSTLLAELVAGQYAQAAMTANGLDYDLTEFMDIPSGQTYYLLTHNNGNYWGTYIYNPTHCRQLVIQAPHPKFDFNTGKQALHVFRNTNALFFAMAGTHRCNSNTPTNCNGTTQVCGSANPEAYKISDFAHRIPTFFQTSTAFLAGAFPNSVFVSLHGFTKLNSDPYVIMSNGTTTTPNPDFITQLRDNLLLEDNVLTFEIPHLNQAWDRLVGFSNTQGRLVNSSPNPCTDDAVSSTGRFIHAEQEKTRLRDNVTGWNKMANALANTFDCAALPVVWQAFSVERTDNHAVHCEWTTALEQNTVSFSIERSHDALSWRTVGQVAAHGFSQVPHTYTFIDAHAPQTRLYYRIRQLDADGRAGFSEVRTLGWDKAERVLYPNPAETLLYVSSAAPQQGWHVVDMLGRSVPCPEIPTTPNASTRILDVAHLRSGIYYLHTADSVHLFFKQ